jgi:hypothetical protein
VPSRAPGLPGGLTAALAGPAASGSAAVISPAGPPPAAMTSIALPALSAFSMNIKIINVKEYGKPVNVKILSVHG